MKLTAALTGLFCLAANSWAEPLWSGDFESGDLSQWQSPINAQGIKLSSSCVHSGKFSGQVVINGDDSFNWFGNKALNRSEFHHRMGAAATHTGKDTYFSFYFYLPKAWSQAKHELGYWESDKSWQQMFRFNIRGQSLGFQQSSANKEFWNLTEGASSNRWHRLALHIHWSTHADKGFVETWADGKAMGKYYFPTLPSDQALMFTQIGVLRTQEPSEEQIFIDDAVEASSLNKLNPSEYLPTGIGCKTD